MFRKLEILGFRGFASRQSFRFSKPNGTAGSGLTIVVGANNSGKSTVIESIRALIQPTAPAFTQGRRNRTAGDKVHLRISGARGNTKTLVSISKGSSETKFSSTGAGIRAEDIFVLPSRRAFTPYFGKSEANREQYSHAGGFPPVRAHSLDYFSRRLFTALQNKEAFNNVLGKILDPVPDWTIDQLDNGDYFLKITSGKSSHSSEGLGEGIVSLLFIVDSLYDSTKDQLIVIDEPELSLHPHLQRKLAKVFNEYSKDRQILLATHSPLFVDFESVINGASIVRSYRDVGKSKLATMQPSTIAQLVGLLRNENNPHILGLKAQEVFFLDDKVVLLEGQEDVIFYKRLEEQLSVQIKGEYYGWGVGGSSNISTIASLLRDLGYKKVVGILDGNEIQRALALKLEFPEYEFYNLPADDVRTKESRRQKRVIGLLDKHGEIRRGKKIATRNVFENVNIYLSN